MNQNQTDSITNQAIRDSAIQSFYQDYGIKQYSCFSGGFKYREKPAINPKPDDRTEELTKDRLYKQFGVSRKNTFPQFYKVENDYVPQTKGQLADRLMDKLQHQMKKMRYYRQKYTPTPSRQ